MLCSSMPNFINAEELFWRIRQLGDIHSIELVGEIKTIGFFNINNGKLKIGVLIHNETELLDIAEEVVKTFPEKQAEIQKACSDAFAR